MPGPSAVADPSAQLQRQLAEVHTRVFEQLVKKMASGNAPPVLGDISDDDIDNLFND